MVQFEYDANGRLWKVADREGQVTTYGYDGATHLLTTITDARGHVAVTNHYDAQGRVDWQKDALGLSTGQQTTFEYVTNADGSKTMIVIYPATSADPTWSFTAHKYFADGTRNPHLHLELRRGGRGVATNPVRYVDANWDDMGFGVRPGPQFQLDLENPRRHRFIDEQPEIYFGGPIISNAARP